MPRLAAMIALPALLCLSAAALAGSGKKRPMNIYIFADMEGISGITSREFVKTDGRFYEKGRRCYTWDINACVEGCFEAGAHAVIVRDGHSTGRAAVLSELDPRAEIIQGPTLERMRRIRECDAVILLGYHAMNHTPDGFLNHTYSSKTVDNMWLNSRLAGEIGIDAGIVSDYGLPVIMVSGDDKACTEAAEWIPGVVTCRVKEGLARESARTMPLRKAYALIRERTVDAIGRTGVIRPVEVSRPVTIRKQMYERIGIPDASRRPDIRRIDERTAEATSETVEKAFLWQ